MAGAEHGQREDARVGCPGAREGTPRRLRGRIDTEVIPWEQGRVVQQGRHYKTGLVAGLALVLALLLPGGHARPVLRPGMGEPLPQGFVDLKEVIPNIVIDLRYSGRNNFVGARIDGYLAPRAILSREAANALAKVQEELRPSGLGLKVFDAYRPQQAVEHFVRWAEDASDTRTKAEFYPDLEKAKLFEQGYVSAHSSHTRGSTVDLTLVSFAATGGAEELDMGSPFDFFGPVSWPLQLSIPAPARAHRLLLRSLMTKHGFEPYPREWWHFTLRDEPFPDSWFDFPVQ
jgi:D-alanyl-D-alanine dipeptidase